MKLKRFSFIVFIGFFLQLSSQELYQPRKFNSGYSNDLNKAIESFNYQRYAFDNMSLSKKYAEVCVGSEIELLRSGEIFYDWTEVNEYLTKVLQSLIPDSVGMIESEVYLTANGYLNAFSIYNGKIFINAGLLAELPNESALAVLLGHELSHYLNRDGHSRFPEHMKRKRQKAVKGYQVNKRNLSIYHDSREQERRCDLEGMKWSEQSGYDIAYGIDLFATFLNEDEMQNIDHVNTRIKSVNYWDSKKDDFIDPERLKKLFSTHPEIQDRIDYLQEYVESESRRTGQENFKIDEATFYEIRTISRYETLKYFLDRANFDQCERRAFRFHLEDPSDPNFIYYIAESLRRRIYAEPEEKNQGFISGMNITGEENQIGILYDPSLLLIDPQNVDQNYLRSLYSEGNPIFSDNLDALDYFLTLGKKRGITEILLTSALLQDEQEKRTNYLQSYIKEGGMHKEFANFVLSGKSNAEMFDSPSFYVVFAENEYYDFKENGPFKKYVETYKENAEYEQGMKDEISEEGYEFKYDFERNILSNDLNFSNELRRILVYGNLMKKGSDSEIETESYYSDVEEESTYGVDLLLLAPESFSTFSNIGHSRIVYHYYIEDRLIYQMSSNKKQYQTGVESFHYMYLIDLKEGQYDLKSSRFTYSLRDQSTQKELKRISDIFW